MNMLNRWFGYLDKETPSWVFTKCVFCNKEKDNDGGITYKYKNKKYHFNCLVEKILELNNKINH